MRSVIQSQWRERRMGVIWQDLREKKEEYLHSAFYISKRSGMDHTVLPANIPCLPFLRKRSPDGVTSN